MTDDEHRHLASILRNVQGKVALSGYDCSLMQELYGDWQCIKAPLKLCHSIKTARQEVLWINYDLATTTIDQKESTTCLQPQQLRWAASRSKRRAQATPTTIAIS